MSFKEYVGPEEDFRSEEEHEQMLLMRIKEMEKAKKIDSMSKIKRISKVTSERVALEQGFEDFEELIRKAPQDSDS